MINNLVKSNYGQNINNVDYKNFKRNETENIQKDISREKDELIISNDSLNNLESVDKLLKDIVKKFKITKKISTGEKLTKEEQVLKSTMGIVVPGAFKTPNKKSYLKTYLDNVAKEDIDIKFDVKK